MSDIEGTGKGRGIEDASRQAELECTINNCGSKGFYVIVVPIIVKPGAAITKLQCAKCRNVFIVSESGTIGDRQTLFQDHQGRNHHRMIAEPGIFDMLGKNKKT